MQQVEQARAGIDALADSQQKIGGLRENFELIDRCAHLEMVINDVNKRLHVMLHWERNLLEKLLGWQFYVK